MYLVIADAQFAHWHGCGRAVRLILMGTYLEHVTGNDPDKRDRLIKGLDVFLERDRDRELFELPLNKEISDGNPD